MSLSIEQKRKKKVKHPNIYLIIPKGLEKDERVINLIERFNKCEDNLKELEEEAQEGIL